MWRVSAHAGGFKISPDGLHMMNTGEGGPGPIFNLQDGSTVRLDKMPAGISSGSDWLDNDRVVIAFQQVKTNPETEQYFKELSKRYHDRKLARDSLIYLRLQCSIDLKLNKVNKEEYDTKTAELTQKIDELWKQEDDENQKVSKEHKQTTILGATRLSVYNIKTQQIESEKNIYAPDGEPIVLRTSSIAVGIINVERATQSIYFCANKGALGKVNQNTRCLVKLDKLLNVVSVVPVGVLTKLNVKDKIYFISGRKYLINNGKMDLLQSAKINTEFGEIRLEGKSNRSIQTFIPGMVVGENNHSLEFSMKKGTQK